MKKCDTCKWNSDTNECTNPKDFGVRLEHWFLESCLNGGVGEGNLPNKPLRDCPGHEEGVPRRNATPADTAEIVVVLITIERKDTRSLNGFQIMENLTKTILLLIH